MTTKRVFIILAIIALLLTLPNVALAQRLPPHVFVGTATIDGAMAADGTTVTAWVGGAEAASATVSGGKYNMIVDQGDQSFSGETITFQIGGNDAAESATWMQGGGDELNLTASSAMAMEPTDTPPEPTAAPVVKAPGATGVPGARGPAGPSGSDGASGSAGAQGDSGPAGSAGSDGSAGAQGDSGPAGSAGAAGDTGASGSTGPAGATGSDGASGDDGSSGALAIVGLILAIIALVGVGGVIVLSRRT